MGADDSFVHTTRKSKIIGVQNQLFHDGWENISGREDNSTPDGEAIFAAPIRAHLLRESLRSDLQASLEKISFVFALRQFLRHTHR